MPVHSGDLNASFAPTLPECSTADTLQRQCVGNRRKYTLIKWHGSVFSPPAGTPLKFTGRQENVALSPTCKQYLEQ